jgi:hypothetical protein
MRSFLSTAAIAAALIASPLTAAFAASAHDHETNSFGGRGAGFHERNANVHGGDADTGTITYAPNGQPSEAVRDNARDGGAIPMGQYEQLMRQVDNLRHQYS